MSFKTIKKRITPHFNENLIADADFDQLLDNISTSHIKEGTVVRGQVVGMTKDIIVVDVGLKNEGRISADEFKNVYPNIGDIVDVFIEKIDGRNGQTVLSRERAIREETWVHLEAAHNNNENVDGKIVGRTKGGFTVLLDGSCYAFLPGSQLDVKQVRDAEALMDFVQPLRILKMDKKHGNIVVSRRAILEERRSGDRDEMLAKIKEGMIIDGVVKNITDYGAFVDLGSIDGLLHVTDISWSRINHPSEILSIGQEIKVKVIKFNEESKRISLGMKQLDDNPWQTIQEEFPVGKVMQGKVTNIADYGVFIELKDGIEGLVHSSEISWIRSNQNPRKSLNIGQEITFMILDVDTVKHRISLSIKQCQDNPLVKFAEANPAGTIIEAPIKNINDFGIFVELSSNIDGMIKPSELSWTGNGAELMKSYKKDEIIKCIVLSVDSDKERISLGVKQLTEAPKSEDLKKNAIVHASVTEISDDTIEVIIDGDIAGVVKKIDLSPEREEQKTDRFNIGDKIEAKVVGTDKASGKILLSIKALELDERQKTIKEFGGTDSGANFGDILGAAMDQNKDKAQ